MSVLIKGMEMPGKRDDFALLVYNLAENGKWVADLCAFDVEQRRLELVEIPTPHGRLIDADALIQRMKTKYCSKCHKEKERYCSGCFITTWCHEFTDAPTVVEAED